MDRIIEVKVCGHHLRKDNRNAGVRGEANVTSLRITFEDGWDDYTKTVTFWDARGLNPVKRILTTELLESVANNTTVYLVPIPAEPMAEAGKMTFIIDGYLDSKRQRSISDTLEVKYAPITDVAGEPVDPTPSQAEQLQKQIDNIPVEPGVGENTIQIKNLNGVAIADNAISMGEGCVAGSKAFYVASIGNNTYTLDSVEDLEVGDVCSAMFLDIMNDTGRVDRVYQDFGTISAINTSTNTITFDVAAPTSSDPTVFVGFMCVLDKPNIGTQMTGIGAFCGGLNGINLSDFGFNYGTGCINVGKGSFVGGLWGKTLNLGAFSWGNFLEASGPHSFAVNNHTKARAGNTCSVGDHTIAGSTNQFVQGRYNIEDIKNIFAHIVGNGTDDENRSNAYTLDWDGNAWFAGDVTVGKDNKKLAKEKVWETIATITVEPDENGNLPYSIVFTKDSDGNDFELTDFCLEAYCTTIISDDYAQENYVFQPTYSMVVVNGATICEGENISNTDFSKWYLRYTAFGENGGGLFIKPSQCISESGVFEGDFENIKVSVAAADKFSPITDVGVYLFDAIPCGVFMQNSTFILKGVRK